MANRFFFSGGRCKSKNRVDNKVVVITGANTGIGFQTALELAKRGARVIIACHDTKDAEKAVKIIIHKSQNEKCEAEYLDLADLDSVRSFAQLMNKKLNRLDILINNAGVMATPYTKSPQGYEMQFAVNHLGHFLLTNLLLDLMKKTPNSRIISVASVAHLCKFF